MAFSSVSLKSRLHFMMVYEVKRLTVKKETSRLVKYPLIELSTPYIQTNNVRRSILYKPLSRIVW